MLVVEGAAPREEERASIEEALEQVEALCAQGLSRKDAVKQTAKALGLSRNELYAAAVK